MLKTVTAITILLITAFMIANEPVIGEKVVINGYDFDTFYFDQSGNPQFFKVVEKATSKSWPVVTFYGSRPLRLNGTIGLVFKEEISLKAKKAFLKEHQLTVVYNDNRDPDYFLVKMKFGTDPFQLAVLIYKSGMVNWAQPDMEAHFELAADIDTETADDDTDSLLEMPDPIAPNDTWYTQYAVGKWHHEKVRSNYAWALEQGDPSIKIAIIDNGVDVEHEDLKDNMFKDLGWNFVNENNDPSFKPHTTTTAYQSRILLAHGTMVAGVAAAIGNNSKGIAGICWDCGIIPVRFLDMDIGTGFVDTFHKTYLALKLAVDNGASVINNSWVWWNQGTCNSVPFNSFVEQAVQYAVKNGRDGLGTIVVWAAGNNYCNTDTVKNFDNDHIVVVSALRHNTLDNLKGYKATYSNYGNAIDVSAPAGDPDDSSPYNGLVATDISNGLGSDSGHYETTIKFAGTSAAAPVVSGAIGLMLSAKPEMKFFEALHCLKKAAASGVDRRIADGDMVDGHNIINSDRELVGKCEWSDIKDPYFDVTMRHNSCFGYGYLDVYEMVRMALNNECNYTVAGCTKDEECPDEQFCDVESGLCILEVGCQTDEECLTYQKCDVDSGLCYFPENPDNTQIPDADSNTGTPDEDSSTVIPDNEKTDNIAVIPDDDTTIEDDEAADNALNDENESADIEEEEIGCGCTLIY